MLEHHFQCPYCWETISILMDLSLATQNYIEDCEVCCNPIQIIFETEDRSLTSFEAHSIEQ
jgi:transcription elongation factor Elf1